MTQRCLVSEGVSYLVVGSEEYAERRLREVEAAMRERGLHPVEGTPEIVAPVVAR